MYVNIGANTMLLRREIIGVFDTETTTGSEITREFLGRATKRREVVNLTEELPRAVVLAGKKGSASLYVTDLSAAAIKRRSKDRTGL